jgi:hypothetical protein
VAWVEQVIEPGRPTRRAVVFTAPADGSRPPVKP